MGKLSSDANTIALWQFDEGSGTSVSDSGPNGFHLGFTNSDANPQWLVPSALTFDGTTKMLAWVADAAAQNTAALTVEMRVRAHNPVRGSRQAIISKYYCTNWDFNIYDNGRLFFEIRFPDDSYAYNDPVGVVFPANEWTYVAVTVDSSAVKFYQDGAPAGEITVATWPNLANGLKTTAAQYIMVGSSGINDAYFDGDIDVIKLSNVARTAAEIAANQKTLTAKKKVLGVIL